MKKIFIVKFYQYDHTKSSMTRFVDELMCNLAANYDGLFIFFTGCSPVSLPKNSKYISANIDSDYKLIKFIRLILNEFRLMLFMFYLRFIGNKVVLIETSQWLASIFCRGVTLTIVHDLIPANGQGLKALYYRKIIPAILRKKKVIVAVSHFTKKKLDLLGIKSTFIPVWVSPTIVDNKIELDASEGYYLYIGTSARHKNFSIILDLYSNISIEKELVCVVPEWDRDNFLSEIFKRKLVGKIKIISNVSNSELSSFYVRAFALIVPSMEEGFGMPIIEAMSLACPVVCSDIPVFREVAGQCAIYFSPTSFNDLYEGLINLENASIYKKQQEGGLRHVNKYRIESICELYREVLDNV